jgi:hypothetical protein
MSFRQLLVVALVAGLPGIAGAQFTTFIPPHPKAVDTVAAPVSVATAATRADTAMNTQLTNMKTWVDSAAGLAPVPMTARDSLATATMVADTTITTTTMRDGSRAPATASELPLIALLGAVTLSAGLLLMRRPREVNEARAPAEARDRA